MKKVYEELGGSIKNLRLISSETVQDVCDAVEIPLSTLKKIEAGTERPEEEVLAMLLSHFEVEEDEALRLWKLAGYALSESEDKMSDHDGQDEKPKDSNKIRINIPPNTPVLYSDMVQVMSNQYGIVLHFLQMTPDQQATVVSRVGMSKEHARSLLEILQRNLDSH